ncbi:hypothetical protein BGX28_001894 [Mortierella sp. GBA30]|nr:hypothetical protein BGX28_001894 [Mortierella sp. GBA30]
MRSNLKIVLAAMLVALIATVAMAAPQSSATKAVAHPTPKVTSPKHPKAPKHPKTTKPHKPAKAVTSAPPAVTPTGAPKPSPAKPSPVKPSPAKPSPTKPGKAGQTGVILNQTDFCVFLPPMVGGDIAANEDRAVAFCTKPNLPGANAQVLPKGFIQSAHFVANTQNNWVQVTGRIDRSKYGLSPKDGGGQYDIKAPVGAKCAGYNYFVQLTEPDAQIYCIRCCKNKADCPVNKSTYGCEKVLGGDYS